ncbi:DUF349 domain-containing protein [Carboxylicivirga linearis]|uniref:DUF349 domain-containing protein n=1 Tax=Carboxylicivirga linearis TaxID=1628157 RepID=A0ABS5JZZ4_9BACT|nr:DUF349 domain-containing protein [Carboxylicivirga linearis]MBS2100059.1 DUF349 domain-containing protein [Carboxylicivirga linearis]
MEANDLNKPLEDENGLNSENQSENVPVENTASEKEETKEEKVEVQPEPKDAEKVSAEVAEKDSDEEKDKTEEVELEPVDHIMLHKDELVKRLKDVLKNYPVEKIKEEVEAIKGAFYKKHKAELEDLKRKFVESGELEENFAPPVDSLEIDLKRLLQEFKARKAEFNRRLEEERQNNYQAKLDVIEGIKELINGQESLNETFQAFRDLQQRWRNIGHIPQEKVHDLWETYNYHIENFYNYIKINKELRDLDLKKNLEAKIGLCEKAEKLLLEPTIVKAFKTLQKYHDQWREIGPVPHDKKEDLWARFKEATSLINKRHQEYFEGLKDQLQKNLEAKTELCEKAEALIHVELHSPKEWEAKSKQLIELQSIWKTIGFAPKKDNNKIYERFRSACDSFFNAKREFFKSYKSEQTHNLELKTELCLQAESMKESTDWKRTTDEYIKIQKRWKEIGPVPRKQSDAIWKRFRSACDAFFDHKSNFFSHKDEEQEKNLELKEALIKEVAAFEASDNSEENFNKLQDFQHRWSEIGHVPIKDKDRVNQEFRGLINQYFDNLNLDEYHKNVEKFRNKIENYKTNNLSGDRLTQERNKIINKLKQLENDITVWENNIGFFAKSKKSEALVRDFKHKIETGRRNIKLLNKKLDMLEDMD